MRLLAFAMLAMTAVTSLPGHAQAARAIEVTAERFEFWPPEITVELGEQVEIHIRSEDTSHGFRIVGAGTNVLVPKRGKGEAVALFKAERPGRYTFECSRMCGAGHNFMRGVLIVREPPAASVR
jgi:cytochrome c oxidase subunit 2